jgi:lipoprotein NlpD
MGCGTLHFYDADERVIRHRVKSGDTLYGIAWSYGHDYREVARWNKIKSPYTIFVGQELLIVPPGVDPVTTAIGRAPQPRSANVAVREESVRRRSTSPPPVTAREAPKAAVTAPARLPAESKPAATTIATPPAAPPPRITPPPTSPAPSRTLSPPSVAPPATASTPPSTASPAVAATQRPPPAVVAPPRVVEKVDDRRQFTFKPGHWIWPTRGKVLRGFSVSEGRKGISISGEMGQAVVAAAAGRVVYSGTGLLGYGNLIIVKHDDTWLSAYAHNSQLLVTEGVVVQQGQQIARMGSNPRGEIHLYFEIRQDGKPVNPQRHLPRQ